MVWRDREGRPLASRRAEGDEIKRISASPASWYRIHFADNAYALFHRRGAVVLARHRADAELASLYRERAIARARAAERDPNAMLN